MKKVTAVLPARNDRRQLLKCIKALSSGSYVPELIIVDDGSDDGTAQMVKKLLPSATLLVIDGHTGYAHAANAGLHLVRTEYALLLRPDLQPGKTCVENLLKSLEERDRDDIFCAVPLFLDNRSGAKNAEDVSEKSGVHKPCAGSSFVKKGSGKRNRADASEKTGAHRHCKESLLEKKSLGKRRAETDIIAVRDGCAMYRMKALEEIGWLDERHFQGLEAFDLSMRAALYGCRTVQAPSAAVRPFEADGEGSSDTFRRQLAAGNAMYVYYKNLPAIQRILGIPLSALTDAAVIASFVREREFDQYEMAVTRGRALCCLEKERRQALDSGVSVYPENLADATFLGIDGTGGRIYPLFLAEKEPFSPDRICRYLRIQRLLTGELHRVIRLIT